MNRYCIFTGVCTVCVCLCANVQYVRARMCAYMYVCMPVCVLVWLTFISLGLGLRPFIFYSFCHLWWRQLLCHYGLSKQRPLHDVQHAAAKQTTLLTGGPIFQSLSLRLQLWHLSLGVFVYCWHKHLLKRAKASLPNLPHMRFYLPGCMSIP